MSLLKRSPLRSSAVTHNTLHWVDGWNTLGQGYWDTGKNGGTFPDETYGLQNYFDITFMHRLEELFNTIGTQVSRHGAAGRYDSL